MEVAFSRCLFRHVAKEFLVIFVPTQDVEARPVQVVVAVERVVRAGAHGAGCVDADDVQCLNFWPPTQAASATTAANSSNHGNNDVVTCGTVT